VTNETLIDAMHELDAALAHAANARDTGIADVDTTEDTHDRITYWVAHAQCVVRESIRRYYTSQ
jgi:hypothetical protein